eukprot:UN08760
MKHSSFEKEAGNVYAGRSLCYGYVKLIIFRIFVLNMKRTWQEFHRNYI